MITQRQHNIMAFTMDAILRAEDAGQMLPMYMDKEERVHRDNSKKLRLCKECGLPIAEPHFNSKYHPECKKKAWNKYQVEYKHKQKAGVAS